MNLVSVLLTILPHAWGTDVSQALDHAIVLMKGVTPEGSPPYMCVLNQMNAYMLVMSTDMVEPSPDQFVTVIEILGRFGEHILRASLSDAVLRRVGAIFESRKLHRER